MPKLEPPPPAPWTDCPACDWRNYKARNGNPVSVRSTYSATWAMPERCGGCGAPLERAHSGHKRAETD